MEYFLPVVAVFLLAIILVAVNRSKETLGYLINLISSMSLDMKTLKKELTDLREELAKREEKPQTQEEKPPYVYQPKPDEEIVFLRKPEPQPEPEINIPDPLQQAPEPEPQEEPEYEPSIFDPAPVIEEAQPIAAFGPRERSTQSPKPPHVAQSGWYENWLKNNPDLEKFIGENLINKIGIAVLVLGIAFFVKYAIDQNWISEAGRVCIGMGCGAILVGIAHYLRNTYRSFSSVLAGGGIAIFYFTIAFAFHQYHLLSQTASFVIMVVITAFAVALSVLYNKLELAIIATIGGFLAPFLVSTGDGNYIVLFTYLLILNVGIMALSWFKRWPALNIISLFFTVIIYGSWLGLTVTDNKPVSYPTALMFATAFYLIFLGMNMINQVRNKASFKPFDFFILLLISATYYAAGMVLLHMWNNGAYQGLFTLGIGIVNLLLAYYVYKKGQADRNLLFLLIGLTFTFITLTIPIQLHGHAITMFWSAEFVLLYWLSTYSGIRLFKYSSALLCALTIISLFMDWQHALAGSQHLSLIFNDGQGIVTNVIAIAAFAAYFLLLRKSGEGEFILGIPNRQAAKMMFALSSILLYITCLFCVNLAFRNLDAYDIPNVYHRMITEVFSLVLIIIIQKNSHRTSALLQVPVFIACIIVYLASTICITDLRNNVLAGGYSWSHLFAHWMDGVLLGILFYKLIQGIRKEREAFTAYDQALSIVISLLIITFLSLELMHIYVVIGYRKNNIEALAYQYGKAGLTSLWGLCSFALIWLGMKHKQKVLRIISLALFSVVLLKLFIFDISDISEGGKIFAFILLGVLLLIVSFMYQKLKKIIIDDHKE